MVVSKSIQRHTLVSPTASNAQYLTPLNIWNVCRWILFSTVSGINGLCNLIGSCEYANSQSSSHANMFLQQSSDFPILSNFVSYCWIIPICLHNIRLRILSHACGPANWHELDCKFTFTVRTIVKCCASILLSLLYRRRKPINGIITIPVFIELSIFVRLDSRRKNRSEIYGIYGWFLFSNFTKKTRFQTLCLEWVLREDPSRTY